MAGTIGWLLDVSVVVFAVSSMLSVGLRYSTQEILRPLRDVLWTLKALLANFVLAPALAYGAVWLLSLDRPLGIGLMLVATAAGSPFVIKLKEIADGEVANVASLLVLLLLATMLYMPLVVPLAAPGASVSVWPVARPLLLTMLLPLAAGHAVEEWAPRWAGRLLPIVGPVSTVSLIVVVVATVLPNLGEIAGLFGTGAILAAVVVIGGAFGLGYLLGGPRARLRRALAMGTAQRNIAAATVVATQGIDKPGVLVMVVTTAVVALLILFPVAWVMARRRAREREEREAEPRSRAA